MFKLTIIHTYLPTYHRAIACYIHVPAAIVKPFYDTISHGDSRIELLTLSVRKELKELFIINSFIILLVAFST
jgi:hypothetical protein